MIDFAYSLISATYEQNKHLPKEEILKKIDLKLREIRFFKNLQGYFFVYDMQGTCLIHPATPQLEGKNLLHVKDDKGKEFIKEGIALLEQKSEVAYDWMWTKEDNNISEKKYGYLKKFEPLDIFVGTGRSESEIFRNIKKEIQKLLINLRYAEKGYIFAYDYSGNTISHIKADFIGKNRWDELVNGEFLIQELVFGAKQNKDGFFKRYIARYDPITKKEALKTSYIKDLPEFGWVIGTGVYYEDTIASIENKQIQIEQKFKKGISHIIIDVVMMLFVIIPAWYVFSRLQGFLKSYQETLIKENHQTMEQKKQLIKELKQDALTKLANRISLYEKLEEFIKRAKRDMIKVAVVFIDLDNFKDINDLFGHDIGDKFLQEFARRLKSVLRETDCAGRLGGDEFLVLLDRINNLEEVRTVVKKIHEHFKEDIKIDGKNFPLTLSMGVSIFPDDTDNLNLLIKQADSAMYSVKKEGKGRFRFFSS